MLCHMTDLSALTWCQRSYTASFNAAKKKPLTLTTDFVLLPSDASGRRRQAPEMGCLQKSRRRSSDMIRREHREIRGVGVRYVGREVASERVEAFLRQHSPLESKPRSPQQSRGIGQNRAPTEKTTTLPSGRTKLFWGSLITDLSGLEVNDHDRIKTKYIAPT